MADQQHSGSEPRPSALERRFLAACHAHQAGRFAQAEALYREVLHSHPGHGECLHLLGLVVFATGRPDEATQLLDRAIALGPGNARWLTAQAHVLAALGRLDEALASLDRVLHLEPSNAAAWIDCGTYLQKSGRPAQAIEAYLRALALEPQNALAHNHLGAVLRQEGDLDGAAREFALAVAYVPSSADAWSNWGVTFHARCDYAEAARKYAEALRLEPDHPDANGHMGSVLSQLGHPGAEQQLRRALALKPNDPEARLNLGLHLLRQGSFAEGWQHYEARWECPEFGRTVQAAEQLRWTGQSSALCGKTLLVRAEQGLGDTIQFVRYLPLVLAAGARVVLQVHPLLLGLLQQWAASGEFHGNLQVVPEPGGEATPLPPFEQHIHLLSLPLAFNTTPASIPPPLRLTPPAAPCPHSGLRVGLCWAGNPRHALDRDRSLALALLAPLFSVPGVTFVSLQRGPAAQQIEASGLPLETPELPGFAATAVLLDSLDLVISVDTAAAHLSATQGVATWILLPYVIDWRWNLAAAPQQPETSAWYPAVRLFRQPGLAPSGSPAGTAWRPVIQRVRTALSEAAQEAPSRSSPATLEA